MTPRRALAAVAGAVDAAVATLLVLAVGAELVYWGLRRRSVGRPHGRALLQIDAAYSLDAVRRRGIEHALTSADLDGYFSHVWHVHPLVGADADEPSSATTGPPSETALTPRHTVVEGHPAMWRSGVLPLSGFVLAQSLLLHRVHRILATEGVCVIRVGDPYYLGIVGLALARTHRVPLAIRINGNYDAIYEQVGRLAYPRLFRRRWVEKRIDQFVLPRADLVAGANENNLQFAVHNGARPDRTAVFRYGAVVDPSHFTDPATRGHVRDELGLDGRPYTVTVSRLEPVKRTEDVVRALALLRPRHPGLAAVLVGDGTGRDDLARLASSLGVVDAVVFAGSRNQEWIARALAGAVAVVAPSAGRALVEAALAGVPLIAYDVDWHRELVVEDDNGHLVPAGDIDGLASAIERVLSDPETAARLGRRARESALEMMDPSMLVGVQQAAYDRLLATRWNAEDTT